MHVSSLNSLTWQGSALQAADKRNQKTKWIPNSDASANDWFHGYDGCRWHELHFMLQDNKSRKARGNKFPNAGNLKFDILPAFNGYTVETYRQCRQLGGCQHILICRRRYAGGSGDIATSFAKPWFRDYAALSSVRRSNRFNFSRENKQNIRRCVEVSGAGTQIKTGVSLQNRSLRRRLVELLRRRSRAANRRSPRTASAAPPDAQPRPGPAARLGGSGGGRWRNTKEKWNLKKKAGNLLNTCRNNKFIQRSVSFYQ